MTVTESVQKFGTACFSDWYMGRFIGVAQVGGIRAIDTRQWFKLVPLIYLAQVWVLCDACIVRIRSGGATTITVGDFIRELAIDIEAKLEPYLALEDAEGP